MLILAVRHISPEPGLLFSALPVCILLNDYDPTGFTDLFSSSHPDM
jgi:hypothetical protein